MGFDISKIKAAAVKAEAGYDTMLATMNAMRAEAKAASERIAALIAANDPAAAAQAQAELDSLADGLDQKTNETLAQASEQPPA